MKIFTKSLLGTLMAAIILSFTGMTSFAAHNYKNFNTPISGINKIWVSGNVKIVLTQSDVEAISMADQYYSQHTSIHSKGQTLYINSSESQQITINITMKDLQRIEASGGSSVVTTGNFDIKYLQIFLNQWATARVKTTTVSLYTVISDDAVLKISGTSDEYILIAENMSNVKLRNFLSLRTESRVSGPVAMKIDNLKTDLLQ